MSAAAIHQLRADLQSRFDIPPGIRSRPDRSLLPTGIAAIDHLTGGIPRGSLTEICGPESSGRTALAVSILSEATRQGEYCAWIDASGSFDPASAATAGAILNRLLWVNCGGNTENALKSCDLLVQAGGFGLVVLDLADTSENEAHRPLLERPLCAVKNEAHRPLLERPLCAMKNEAHRPLLERPSCAVKNEARRISLASWFRLRHAAERSGAALVALENRINAQSCSALQLEMRRKRVIARGKLLAGLALQAETRKHFQLRTADLIAVR